MLSSRVFRLHFLPAVFVVVSPGLASLLAEEPPAEVDADEMAEALQQGYLANREAFPAFTCRFVLREGGANTVEDALEGKLFNVVVSNGLWVVNDARQRYELICDDPEREEPQPPDKPPPDDKPVSLTSVDCISKKLLSDGVLGLSYVPRLLTANIGTRHGTDPEIVYTPLSMGIMGSGEQLGPALRQRPGFDVFRRYGGRRMVDGAAREILVTGEVGGSRKEWWLDAQRGFLPMEVRYHSGGEYLDARTVVTEVRNCSNGAYFPERSVTIMHPNAPIPKRAWIIELRELDLTRPAKSTLAIEIDPGSDIVEPPTMLASVRVSSSERVNVGDLETWVQRCRESRAVKLAERRPHAEPTGMSPGRLLFVLANLAMFASVAGWLAWRWYRRRGRSPAE